MLGSSQGCAGRQVSVEGAPGRRRKVRVYQTANMSGDSADSEGRGRGGEGGEEDEEEAAAEKVEGSAKQRQSARARTHTFAPA